MRRHPAHTSSVRTEFFILGRCKLCGHKPTRSLYAFEWFTSVIRSINFDNTRLCMCRIRSCFATQTGLILFLFTRWEGYASNWKGSQRSNDIPPWAHGYANSETDVSQTFDTYQSGHRIIFEAVPIVCEKLKIQMSAIDPELGGCRIWPRKTILWSWAPKEFNWHPARNPSSSLVFASKIAKANLVLPRKTCSPHHETKLLMLYGIAAPGS